MNIAFRVDASVTMGVGHVMRTLTLANVLLRHAAKSTFLCRQLPTSLRVFVESAGHQVVMLDDGATSCSREGRLFTLDQKKDVQDTIEALRGKHWDWLIVDHYEIDCDWESLARLFCSRLMVIDDLANRKHDCDLLLDQTFGRTYESYKDLIVDSSAVLIGSRFAILRPEFPELREYSIERRKGSPVKNILISLGGTDPNNLTGRLVAFLVNSKLIESLSVQVVLGSQAPALEEVRSQIVNSASSFELLVDVMNMGELLAESDLVIGAAGTSAWERCCLGVPTLMVIIAENQREIAESLGHVGAGINLGSSDSLTLERELINCFTKIIDSPDALAIMQYNASSVTDGRGALRVVGKLIELS